MMQWRLMAEEGNPGGGENPPPANDPPKNDPPPANDPPKNDPPPANDPPKNDPPKNDPPPANDPPKKTEQAVNLMDDETGGEPEKKESGAEEPKPPTDEEQKTFREAIKTIDIGEGVKWDDPALSAMTPELMKISGGDPKKAEGIVKAYTAYQQEQVRQFNEANDKFLNGLVEQCKQRFGSDLKQVCALAKEGGRRIFGDYLWNVMKKERAFANNPDIIEKLAAFGRSTKDDPGATKKETGTTGRSSDWRENMYGGAKK